MKTKRFFTFVWRVNAVLIFVVGVLAAVVLSALAYIFFKDAIRTRYVGNVANAALSEVETQIAELQPFQQIQGTGVLRAALNIRQTYSLGSGSKEAIFTRNYLYFDVSTRSAYWLKATTDGLILQVYDLPGSPYGQNQSETTAVVYVAVERDSDGDHRLSDSDIKRIAVSDSKGKNYRVVVDRADRLNDARLLRPDRLLILYSLGSKLTAVELDPRLPDAPVAVYEVKTETK
jgi:hypothetical protein